MRAPARKNRYQKRMPLVLVISSFVASSQVGARPAAAALAARKIDTVVVPTTLLGRHPGWGPPGGGAVSAEMMQGVLDGVAAQGLFGMTDAVLTGYFASPEQVEIAARAIEAVRAANENAVVLVDPIMGDDDGGLFVSPDTAQAVVRSLLPRADFITPNLWELRRLAGRPLASLEEIAAAARQIAPRAAVTSVREPGAIGALYVDAEEAWLALAPEEPRAPHGAGDLFAGALLAAALEGLPAAAALHRAVGVTADVVRKAVTWNAPELPIVAAMDSFAAPAVRVSLRRIKGDAA